MGKPIVHRHSPNLWPEVCTKAFNVIADGVQWVALQRGVSNLNHFLDDFILTGKPNTNKCKNNLQRLVHTYVILNLLLALSKLDGPTTCLGIELDVQLLQMWLPSEKLLSLKSSGECWFRIRNTSLNKKKELRSLEGLLHESSLSLGLEGHIRRLLDLLKASHFRSAKAPIRLNVEARSDILWWKQFISNWNGVSMMQNHHRANPELSLTSDASGS